MSKITEYWESYDRFYSDFEKEGMNLEDLLLKSKFGFNAGKLTFSSKSKFNLGKNASHEISLKHKCSKLTAELKTKTGGENTLEVEADLYKKDDIKVGLFANSTYKLSECSCDCNTKAHFRVHHKDNALVTLGLENWDCCKGIPKDLVVGTSFGKVNDGHKFTVNTKFNFNIDSKFLQLAQFFVKGTKGDFTGLFNANLNRQAAEGGATQDMDFSFRFTKQLDDKVKVGGSLTHEVNSKKTNFAVVGSKQFDRVRVNGKVSSDRDLTVGITSVQDDITFSFAAKSTLACKTQKEGDAEKVRHFVNYGFGATVEFTRI